MTSPRAAGKPEYHPARDLKFIPTLQRLPTRTRMKKLEPWDEEKAFALFGARITDGRYKGQLHIFDGVGRLTFMLGGKLEDGGVWEGRNPGHMFEVLVWDKTEKEAAGAFLAVNQEASNVSAYNNLKVGPRAGDPAWTAVSKALEAIPLVAVPGGSTYGDKERKGEISAVKALRNIANRHHTRTGDWEAATATLTWVIRCCRRCYTEGTYTTHGKQKAADAHGADILQAVSSIIERNPEVMGHAPREQSLREAITTWYGPPTSTLAERQLMRPGTWVGLGKGAGSETRGRSVVADLITTNHNRAAHIRPDDVPWLKR